jgi:hypothetical protein
MAEKLTPLSSTVASIFAEFLKRLEADGILGPKAIESLRESLEQQKLDHESLRKAIFTPAGETTQ